MKDGRGGRERGREGGRGAKNSSHPSILPSFSSFNRTKQTLARIVECLEGNTIVGVREEPRLTEQVGGRPSLPPSFFRSPAFLLGFFFFFRSCLALEKEKE